MIKKVLIVGAGVLLLAAVLVGRDTASYIKTAWNRVHMSAKDTIPISFEIDRARNMIRNLAPEIKHNMERIAHEEVEVAKLQRKLDRQEQQLAQSRNEILRLKGDLESGQTHFVYSGRAYSENQVKTDLSNRFQYYKTSEATAEQLRKILTAREKCLTAARDKLEGMLASKRQLEVQVENLEARLKMVEVAQTTSEFNFDDSELSRTRELIDDITTRLEVSEKLLNQSVQLYDRIPLEETASDTDHVLDAVTEYFSDAPDVQSVAGSNK